jgi:hypothetical protein
MTAQIFDLRGQPFQPAAARSEVGPRIPGQLRLVEHLFSPEEITTMRLRARMHLRNALDLYRDAFGSDRLAAVLISAAEDEIHLIKADR